MPDLDRKDLPALDEAVDRPLTDAKRAQNTPDVAGAHLADFASRCGRCSREEKVSDKTDELLDHQCNTFVMAIIMRLPRRFPASAEDRDAQLLGGSSPKHVRYVVVERPRQRRRRSPPVLGVQNALESSLHCYLRHGSVTRAA
jgi:hypothetical protein